MCFVSSRMLQMLSGPTLHRLTVTVPSTIVGAGGSIDVDTHVRMSGGQDYSPYVDQPFLERFGAYLANLELSVYQEFADALLKVTFVLVLVYFSCVFFSELHGEYSFTICSSIFGSLFRGTDRASRRL